MAAVVGSTDLRLNAGISCIHYCARTEVEFTLAAVCKGLSKVTLA